MKGKSLKTYLSLMQLARVFSVNLELFLKILIKARVVPGGTAHTQMGRVSCLDCWEIQQINCQIHEASLVVPDVEEGKSEREHEMSMVDNMLQPQ